MGQATLDLPDPLQHTEAAEGKSADELLSQLAGSEIDRLLAESDGEQPAVASLARAEPVLQAESINSPGANTEASAVAPTSPSTDLDAVLETAVAQREADRLAVHSPAKPVLVVDEPQIELGAPASRLPLFLRPLEWLSAPLDPWPDQLREVLGKVGLLTLINAMAVLGYVMIFRHHHK